MQFPFKPLTTSRRPMPVVPVSFPQLPGKIFPGLVDSGAAGTRIPADLAEALDVDLRDALRDDFIAGARSYHSLVAEIDMTVGRHTRRTSVSFTEGWQQEHLLLGIRGFFQNYVVRIDAPREITSLTPTRRSAPDVPQSDS